MYGGSLGGLGYAKEEGSNETYIGGFNANAGAMIKFVIDSPEDTKVTLLVSVCKRNASILFTNSILVQVNGEIIESKCVVPGIGAGESEWVTFVDVNLGCVDLVQGRNTITFTCVSGDAGTGFNFNSITIKSNVTINWYEGTHVCDDVCSECGGCRNEMCNEKICEIKCTCDKAKYEFPSTDEEVSLNGVVSSGDYVELTNVNQSITYNLKSFSEIPGVLFVDVMSDTITSDISEVVAIKVNGNNVSSSGAIGNTFTTFEFGTSTFKYGENIVEITSKVAGSIKVKGITIACDGEIVYKNPNEFLTTSNYVTIEGKSFKSSENCISMIENAKGSIVTFPIKSSKATTADLYFNMASRATPAKISEIWEIRVNNQLIATDADLPNIGREYFTYNDVFINNVSLLEGHNEITIKVISDSLSINTNLRAAIFDNTDATLTWSTEGPQLNKTVIEAEYATLGKITYQDRTFPTQYLNNPTDPLFAGYSGEGFLGGINDCGVYKPGEATISFVVDAEEAVSAKFYFGAGVSGSTSASNYKVSVGSNDYESAQSWSGDGWYAWAEHYYGTIDLSAGSNVVTVTILAGSPLNLDYFAIYSTTNVTFNR